MLFFGWTLLPLNANSKLIQVEKFVSLPKKLLINVKIIIDIDYIIDIQNPLVNGHFFFRNQRNDFNSSEAQIPTLDLCRLGRSHLGFPMV
jgi:hypothetical protein